MHITPRIVVAAGAALLLVAGCTSAPETAPPPPPPPSFVPYAPEVSPTSSVKPSAEWEWVPGPLRSGPTPGTVLGPTGKVLRLIPADPDRSFKCRTLTATERRQLELDAGSYERSKATRAVDLPEGYSIVGYWEDGLDGPEPAALLSGERFVGLGIFPAKGWYGSHTNAGVAFEDGPKALRAALECIS